MLDFDDATHTYTLAGVRVPSVTQILKPLTDLSGIPREVLEAKRDLGSRVHEACEYDAADDLDEASVEPDVAPYLAAWRAFMSDSGARIVHSERIVYEPVLRYAGKLDLVLDCGGDRILTDIKTSIVLPHAVGAQTAGYMRALADTTVTRRAALRLRPDGAYRLDQLTGADDWSVFMAALTLYRWKERNGL